LNTSTPLPERVIRVLRAPSGIKAKGSLRMPSPSINEGQACKPIKQATAKPHENATRILSIQFSFGEEDGWSTRNMKTGTQVDSDNLTKDKMLPALEPS
jgi:hypothetical protein